MKKLFLLVAMICCSLLSSAQEFKAAAEQGDATAQTKMGDYHFDKKEYTQAIEWYEKAAAQNNVDAILQLIDIYEEGYGVAKDEKKGVMYEKKAAELGNAKAQYYLANTYHNGYGGEAKNLSKAVEWQTKAAEQGYAKAQKELGDYFYKGDGVTQDYTKAVEWYRKAAEQGYAAAQDMLGDCYRFGNGVTKDYDKAEEWFLKAAAQGNRYSQCSIGKRYYYGEGVEKDYPKAVEWFRKAADQGDAEAQNILGDCYYHGEGVTQDYAKAVDWYRKAAEKGNRNAYSNLGICYYKGYGVTKDLDKSVEWFNKAQQKGKDCSYWLGCCYEDLNNYAKAIEWYANGSDEGDSYCSSRLGNIYQYGRGVQKNVAKAKEYYKKAIDQGSTDAKEYLAELEKEISNPNTSTTVRQPVAVKDDAEISLHGHIDFLVLEKGDSPIQIPKDVKADYTFKVFTDPSDRTAPRRKTVVLTCDIDWKKFAGSDEELPMDYSWSSKRIVVANEQSGGNKGYSVVDGNENVLIVLPNYRSNGKGGNFIFLYGGGSQLAGLRQGMYIDDLARQVQKEIPGTRVVDTGNKSNGLNEYALLSYGERKVYEVTGDYHYAITNNERYFTFWIDNNKRLVKWFRLK